MVNKALIRPHFLEGVVAGGIPLDSHDRFGFNQPILDKRNVRQKWGIKSSSSPSCFLGEQSIYSKKSPTDPERNIPKRYPKNRNMIQDFQTIHRW